MGGRRLHPAHARLTRTTRPAAAHCCQTRKIHTDGIHFLSLRYLDPVLAFYTGEQAIIRYDPRDITEIRVYLHRAGTVGTGEEEFLCRAICPELAGTTISLKEITTARYMRTTPADALRHGHESPEFPRTQGSRPGRWGGLGGYAPSGLPEPKAVCGQPVTERHRVSTAKCVSPLVAM
ncbi:Mu transposase C-terminal domain-containing protein [Nonomuraea sp. M3C6]|uniref:Mu transposase C-terminal domain-containing protein n=1 Tax=Nonomuraea marmarensis TaxID=3351344 RepID=A0ABW7ATF1_9ACTN